MLFRSLDEATYAAVRADVPVLREPSTKDRDAAAYFTEVVRRFLFDQLGGDAVLEGGLRVETTLDIALQTEATASVQDGLRALSKRQGYRGPLRRVAKAEIAETRVGILTGDERCTLREERLEFGGKSCFERGLSDAVEALVEVEKPVSGVFVRTALGDARQLRRQLVDGTLACVGYESTLDLLYKQEGDGDKGRAEYHCHQQGQSETNRCWFQAHALLSIW